MTQQLESSITVVAANWYDRCFEKDIEFDQYIESVYQKSVVAHKYDVPKRGLFGRMKPAQVQDKAKWISRSSRYYKSEIYPYYVYFERVKYLTTMLDVAIRDNCRTVTLSAKDLWILQTNVSKWAD